MRYFIAALALLLMICSLILLGNLSKEEDFNAPNEKNEASSRDSMTYFNILLGDTQLNIPAAYLPKSKDQKSGPQDTIVVSASVPGLNPIGFNDPLWLSPTLTNNIVNIMVEAARKKGTNESLLRSWEQRPGNVKIPDAWHEDGLIFLGDIQSGSRGQKIYTVVQNGAPVAQISCSNATSSLPALCQVYQSTSTDLKIGPISFLGENLHWYANQGLFEIEDLLLEWIQSDTVKGDFNDDNK